jgi:hypothetical protein
VSAQIGHVDAITVFYVVAAEITKSWFCRSTAQRSFGRPSLPH